MCHLTQLSKRQLADVGECEYDEGGYFVINGSEKVLIAQERMSTNHVYVFKAQAGSKFSYVAEIRSSVDISSRPTKTLYVKMQQRGNHGHSYIYAEIPYVKKMIPIAIIFRALGFVSDRDILQHIVYDLNDNRMMDLLRPSLEEAFAYQSKDLALDFIARRGTAGVGVSKARRLAYAKEILQKEFLPHVGVGDFFETKKAFFFGYIVHRLLATALGRRQEDDRDHYGNKRLDLAGPMLSSLFRQLFAKLHKSLRGRLQRQLDEQQDFNLPKAVQFEIIDGGLRYCLATGNWSANKGPANKTGVSQVLNRLTFASTLSHLRRLNTPIGKESKLAKPRQLHNTHWGIVCPAETPEGQMCGLVKNLSLMTHISVGSPVGQVAQFMEDFNIENLEEIDAERVPSATKIFLNGSWVGIHTQAHQLVNQLKTLRRTSTLEAEIAVIDDIQDKEVHVWTDSGRCCRPLFVVENKRLLIKNDHIVQLIGGQMSFTNLVQDGIIEYIDVEEEETCMIAMFPHGSHTSRTPFCFPQC
jgi:DNA-directed RNA polymerase II subunit RPB2